MRIANCQYVAYFTAMPTFRDIIERWPSLGEYADEIGVRYVTAQVMKHRNKISSGHWKAVVSAAKRRGFKDITYDLLVDIEEETRKRSRPPRRRSKSGAAVAA